MPVFDRSVTTDWEGGLMDGKGVIQWVHESRLLSGFSETVRELLFAQTPASVRLARDSGGGRSVSPWP